MSDKAPLYISELPCESRIVDWSSKRVVGNDQFVDCTCPKCGLRRPVLVYNLCYRPTQTTYCSEHKWIPEIKWVGENEFSGNPDIILDYSKQVVNYSTKHRKKRAVFIMGRCPVCQEWRWVRSNCLRAGTTTLCPACAAKRAHRRRLDAGLVKLKNDGIEILNGYRYIHKRVLESRLSTEQMALVENTLRCHRDRYPEHRVVALLKYGSVRFKGRVIVRHLDGNKLNNLSDNLAIGTQADNIQDHASDRKEMKIWRGLAMSLWRLLISIEVE